MPGPLTNHVNVAAGVSPASERGILPRGITHPTSTGRFVVAKCKMG